MVLCEWASSWLAMYEKNWPEVRRSLKFIHTKKIYWIKEKKTKKEWRELIWFGGLGSIAKGGSLSVKAKGSIRNNESQYHITTYVRTVLYYIRWLWIVANWFFSIFEHLFADSRFADFLFPWRRIQMNLLRADLRAILIEPLIPGGSS